MDELVRLKPADDRQHVTAADLIESVQATERLIAELPVEAFEQQGDFFDDGQVGIELAQLGQPGAKVYTAEKLNERVGVRDLICRLLADGVGILRIAKLLRSQGIPIGEHSIMALRDRRPDLVAIEKRQLSAGLGSALKLMLETYTDALVQKRVPATQIPIAFGIFADKKAMIDGDAGMIVEHRHTVAQTADGFAQRLEALKRAKVTDVKTVPGDSESTGKSAETKQ